MKTLIYDIISASETIDAVGHSLLEPFGLTPMTFNILSLLKDGPLSQREISDQVIVAASSITFQVRQLQKKGLIQRRRSDARTWRVSLTPLGAEKRRLAEHEMDRLIDQIQLDPRLIADAKSAVQAVKSRLLELSPAKSSFQKSKLN
jgi:DNA-binding MarR family transcriptional regulator